MIHFYSANTNIAWYKKPFNFSWWIKVFTAYERPEGMSFAEIPTHVSIGEDITYSGRHLIFESYFVQMLNPKDNPHYTVIFTKDGNPIVDTEIFWQIVDEKTKHGYAVLQLIDFIRLWFWNKVFGRDPKNVWFPQSDVCSEIGYNCSMRYSLKYDLRKLHSNLVKSNSNFYHPLRLHNVLKVSL